MSTTRSHQQRQRRPVKLGIEEPEVERGVMHDQHAALDEAEQIVGKLVEAELVREELQRQTVHLVGGCGTSGSD